MDHYCPGGNDSRSLKCRSVFITVIVAAAMIFASAESFAASYSKAINAFTYDGYSIPAYDGDPYEELRGDDPNFNSSELTQSIYARYGALDDQGRVTTCQANIDQSLMPKVSRGEISSIIPTGWWQNRYSFVSGGYLFDRCHLIGFQLTGQNASRNNLMTGTQYFNVSGMLPFENRVASYLKENSANNVLYRVTPVFSGNNKLAYGVIMEAESVDDNGASVKYCVFVYNMEPGVSIDYSTGDNISSSDAEQAVKLSECKIVVSPSACSYTGRARKPALTVQYRGRAVNASNYNVSYYNNTYVGTAKVKVSGKAGNCTGSVIKTFAIVPRAASISRIAAGRKSMTVRWSRVLKQSTGYQIRYSLRSNMSSSKITTVKSYRSSSKIITQLRSKKRYYVQIRTYKVVGKTKYYSAWGSRKSVVVR